MKNKALYRIPASVVAAVLLQVMLASCADTAPESGAAAKGETIRFTASLTESGKSGTRAWADAYDDRFPAGTAIDVFLYTSDDRELSSVQFGSPKKWIYKTVGEVDEASGRSLLAQTEPRVNPDPDDDLPKFPTDLAEGGYVDVFAAFCPSGCSVSPAYESITPDVAAFTFSVQTDQTRQENVKASDFLANDVTSTFRGTSSAVNLEMKHRMAKILVEFNATEDLNALNMPNETYSVENVKTALSITPKTGEITTTTGAASTVTARVGEPFFLPPQTIAAGTEMLKFNLRNIGGAETGIKNVVYRPAQDMIFSEGVFYILTLNVGVRYITLTTTIKNWTGETIQFDKIIL